VPGQQSRSLTRSCSAFALVGCAWLRIILAGSIDKVWSHDLRDTMKPPQAQATLSDIPGVGIGISMFWIRVLACLPAPLDRTSMLNISGRWASSTIPPGPDGPSQLPTPNTFERRPKTDWFCTSGHARMFLSFWPVRNGNCFPCRTRTEMDRIFDVPRKISSPEGSRAVNLDAELSPVMRCKTVK